MIKVRNEVKAISNFTLQDKTTNQHNIATMVKLINSKYPNIIAYQDMQEAIKTVFKQDIDLDALVELYALGIEEEDARLILKHSGQW